MMRTLARERVLAYGESTGHKHAVSVDVFEREDGLRQFLGPTTITHEEHRPVEVPVGEQLSGQIQEYDYLEQQLRVVKD